MVEVEEVVHTVHKVELSDRVAQEEEQTDLYWVFHPQVQQIEVEELEAEVIMQALWVQVLEVLVL
jgi:hypothetical protein